MEKGRWKQDSTQVHPPRPTGPFGKGLPHEIRPAVNETPPRANQHFDAGIRGSLRAHGGIFIDS